MSIGVSEGLRQRLADATASRDVRDVQGAVMTAIQTFGCPQALETALRYMHCLYSVISHGHKRLLWGFVYLWAVSMH